MRPPCEYEDLFGPCGRPSDTTAKHDPKWGGTKPLCIEHNTIMSSLIQAQSK